MTRLTKLRARELALLREIASLEQSYIRCGAYWRELDRLEDRLATLRANIALLVHPAIEYEDRDGVPTLVLRHWKGRTQLCPWCGCYHVHSPHDGHCVPHCHVTGDLFVVAPDGTLLKQNDGYILRSCECLSIVRRSN